MKKKKKKVVKFLLIVLAILILSGISAYFLAGCMETETPSDEQLEDGSTDEDSRCQTLGYDYGNEDLNTNNDCVANGCEFYDSQTQSPLCCCFN